MYIQFDVCGPVGEWGPATGMHIKKQTLECAAKGYSGAALTRGMDRVAPLDNRLVQCRKPSIGVDGLEAVVPCRVVTRRPGIGQWYPEEGC